MKELLYKPEEVSYKKKFNLEMLIVSSHCQIFYGCSKDVSDIFVFSFINHTGFTLIDLCQRWLPMKSVK